ncbi:MAG TPA: GldG family protein [Ignavibacteriaceae bacterium]|nr:GldG family protein [Ignavibacteriaceae bacterium]
MVTKQKIITSLLLLAGILIVLNFLAYKFFVRLDFTEGGQYTLSDATKTILKSLDEPVTVTAYFSENLPPDVQKVKSDFKDILTEYNSVSGGKIAYQFINPGEDQQLETEAQQSGIRPVVINVRERDQMKQQKAYLGAVLQYGEKKEVIPLIQPGTAMEYDLSSNIKKMTLQEKTQVGLLQGNGEPTLQAVPQLAQQLSIMYDVKPVTLNDSTDIPGNLKTLVIIAPKDTIPPSTLSKLDGFLSKGGRILAAINRVDGDLSNASGKSVSTGLSDWLSKKGIKIDDDFIIDVNSGNVMVRQNQGMFMMNTPVKFPYLPIISKFDKHPITTGIEQVMMPFASPVIINPPDTSLHYVNLAYTSDKTGLQKPPVYFDVMKNWTRADFPKSSLPVAAALSGKIDGANTKMVIFGDGDFAVNGEGQGQQKLQADNVNLMSNAIDWLSDDTGLIALRTKGVTSRPLDPDIEEGTKTLVKYLNFLLPIFLIIMYGVVRYRVRKNKRNKWMSENYV